MNDNLQKFKFCPKKIKGYAIFILSFIYIIVFSTNAYAKKISSDFQEKGFGCWRLSKLDISYKVCFEKDLTVKTTTNSNSEAFGSVGIFRFNIEKIKILGFLENGWPSKSLINECLYKFNKYNNNLNFDKCEFQGEWQRDD